MRNIEPGNYSAFYFGPDTGGRFDHRVATISGTWTSPNVPTAPGLGAGDGEGGGRVESKNMTERMRPIGIMEWRSNGVMLFRRREPRSFSTPKRRCFIIPSLLLCALLFLTASAYAANRPNVLFILVDDMGWKDLACYGSEFHETPHIDGLAKRGMRFTNAYAACPICSPSRAAILTGKFPSTSGYVDNFVSETRGGVLKRTEDRSHLDPEAVTLAESLKAGGYQTGFLGKWHLANDDEAHLPTDQGFDVNVGGGWKGHPHNGFFSPYKLAHLEDGPNGEYLTDRLTTEAIGVLDQFSKNDAPWLLYMSYYTVHAPFHSKPEKKAPYASKTKNPAFSGMVASLDENVGRLLAWLDQSGARDNTIVVFTSDNGGHIAASDIAPLRSYKGALYEGGIRVPCIIDWPGVIEPGSVSDAPIHGVDFYATLLAMAGLPLQPDQHQDSVSLVPLLKGEAPNFDRVPMVWHFPVGVPHIAHSHPGSVIRDGDWKFLRFYTDGREELYKLSDDVGETKNLIATMPEKAKELKAQLDAVLAANGAAIPKTVPEKPTRKARGKKGAKANQPKNLGK